VNTDATSPPGSGKRTVKLGEREVGVTTYKVGNRYGCRVDNVDPGDIIGRGSGDTVAEAELAALTNAGNMLNLHNAMQGLRASVSTLRTAPGSPPVPGTRDADLPK